MTTTIEVIKEVIQLQRGELYAGIVFGKDGAQNHHLILLPGEADSIKWKATGEWAVKAGGELPTRREQSLLYANIKEQFQGAWYWSCEQHASDADFSWFQNFNSGSQDYTSIDIQLRARAVRRVLMGASYVLVKAGAANSGGE